MKTVLIDNVRFKTALSGAPLADVMGEISSAKAEFKSKDKTFRALLKANGTESQNIISDLQNEIITCPRSLIYSAFRAGKKLPEEKRPAVEHILEMALKLDLTSPISEPVPVHPKPKKSGGLRVIQNPGLRHRTAQDVVLRCLGPYFKPRPFQFTSRGVPAAIAKSKSCVKAGRFYSARLDVIDYYPSFDQKKLVKELPLPEELVANVVLGRQMQVVMDQGKHGHSVHYHSPHTHDDLLNQARLGIPQGSVCSPIVSMLCMSCLSWHSMPGVTLINYADDFLLLSESETLLAGAIGELKDAVVNLPGGHFTLKLKEMGHASKGIEFLGHHLRITNGKLVTHPMDRHVLHITNVGAAVDDKLEKHFYPPGAVINKEAGLQSLARLVAQIEGWSAAFRECDDLKPILEHLYCGVQIWLEKFEVTMEEVKAAIDPSMHWSPSDYALDTD